MSDHRAVFRTVVRTALAADARIGCFTSYNAWFRSKSLDSGPAYTVHIPQDPSRLSSVDGREWLTQIEVILKRQGSDTIEDDIDLDVTAIDRAVLPALLRIAGVITAEPEGVEFEYNGEGAAIVVQAKVRFRTLICTDLPTGE